jgi:hypothetical protein
MLPTMQLYVARKFSAYTSGFLQPRFKHWVSWHRHCTHPLFLEHGQQLLIVVVVLLLESSGQEEARGRPGARTGQEKRKNRIAPPPN